jgi:hypothetical protein
MAGRIATHLLYNYAAHAMGNEDNWSLLFSQRNTGSNDPGLLGE